MAARQPAERSCPGQGWSTTRPTRTSRQIWRRGKPDPVISSDSDVELIEDPRLKQRRWRLQKATSVRAASPPGWLPEVPRYEGSPTRPPSPEGEALPPQSPPPPQPDTPPPPTRRGGESPRWRPARPPTPKFERPPAAESHLRRTSPSTNPETR
ncbi:uncharacterized protein LOC127011690 [Drosophila biarmipes]|uniref:uncharacterized protein LOC127011690 n=1 Tax=Drosophila biarmipes TaxID=125945 RepID=UPI0021CCF114|nr:uncharacterized protein LOC127011690 [Drosophila biarmipes]